MSEPSSPKVVEKEIPETKEEAPAPVLEKKRDLEDSGDKKKKRQRRRKYEDEVPKEEPKSDEEAEFEAEEDNLDDDDDEDFLEIDESNIITSGRRTRGKVVDYRKAAEQIPEDDEDDEEFDVKETEE